MIDVAVTPAELRSARVAVVIDVLRATSTATQALAAGYRRVLCAESVARAYDLRAPGRVSAGERHCLAPPGFDHGNSPIDAARRRGDELTLATTNGAPTIVAAALRAPMVVLACLLNLDAVTEALRSTGDGGDIDVQIVCSGTDGRAALEDVYVAGRVSGALAGPRTDAALVAEAVARGYPTPLKALAASADARTLTAAGFEPDIAYCAQESLVEVVPRVLAAADGVATVASNGTRSELIAEQDRRLAIPSTP